jgi:hypothetical protein
MCTVLRCNDCRLAQHDGKKLRCTETGTFISPFATVCHKFQPRGKNTIGSGLIRILRDKEGRSDKEKGGITKEDLKEAQESTSKFAKVLEKNKEKMEEAFKSLRIDDEDTESEE